jgi:SAM-dependent methyltransferase
MENAINNWFAPAIERKDAKILLFGCADGRGVELLQHAGFTNVTGLDEDAAKVAAGKAKGFNLVHGNVYDLLGQEFDFVFASAALVQVLSVRDTAYILRTLTKEFIFFAVPILANGGVGNAPKPNFAAAKYTTAEIVHTLDGLQMPHKVQEVEGDRPELWGIVSCTQTRSDLRRACDQFVRDASIVTCAELKTGKLLYVGTAGDPVGGEYTAYFPCFDRKTADADARWNPDIVCDITKSDFPDTSWDVVVCSNVVEHVPDLIAFSTELARIIKPGGHLLIDCPWSYPYHAEPPSFGDFWRISLDGFGHLFSSSFTPIMMEQKETSTHALYKRKAQS